MNPTGILLVDKPQGMTSHDVVARARRAIGTRKVGHAGTLDPMATGLLVLGAGSATRLLTHLVGLGKRYTTTFRLGISTATDDAEGEPTATADASGVAREHIDEGIRALTGTISQVPSTYSAVKVQGRRAYDRARSGEEVVLAPREVTVSRFEVLAERRSGAVIDLDAVIECSSGTYIRALARDLGAALGVGGHLTALRRETVGPFEVADAVAVDDIAPASLRTPASIAAQLFPVARLDAERAVDLAHGKRVRLEVADAPVVAAITPAGVLAGLVEVRDGQARVLVNFPSDEVLR
ncbi:MAG: tRNA pseudouridine(55) synthase TruB [Microbacteriaceae bacterium]|nr:tRNA pseudouridine(55) synthase TruB [Microbacteriaceae bacterium]